MLSVSDISKAVEGSWFVEPVDRFLKMRLETDSRKDCSGACFVAFSGENFDAHNFLEDVIEGGAKVVCVESHPSDSSIHMATCRGCGILKVNSTLKAYQAMGSYLLKNFSKCRVIGITGSSGKTSVKSILAHLLEDLYPDKVLSTEGNTNNHIGVPQNLLRLKGNEDYAVIEMGTNHPGEIATLAQIAPPDVAVLTSIGDSHSGNFDPVDGILNEKADIVKFMKFEGVAVVPFSKLVDLRRTGALAGRRYVTFGSEEGADYQVIYHGGNYNGSSFTLKYKSGKEKQFQSKLTGKHQAENCAACLAALSVMGIKLKNFLHSFEDMQLPGMRMKVSEESGVRFINDAYNANPQSMVAFFEWLTELEFTETFEGEKYLVIGDMLELGDRSLEFHQNVYLSAPKGWKVIAVGEYGSKAFWGGEDFEDSSSAAEYLVPLLRAGDTVALKGSRGIHLEEIIEHFKEERT